MLIINGQAYEEGAPEVTLLNRSFRYGDGLYESLRVWNGQILFLEDHLVRLCHGMKVLKFEFEEEAWLRLMKKELPRVIEVNQISMHGRLRLQVYRGGTGGIYPLDDRPLYLIEAYSLKENYFQHATTASLTIFKDIPLHFSPLSGIKTANSLAYILAARHARKSGFDEALLFCEGYVSAASNHHLFIVKDQKIITPPLKSACHDGVMRKHIQLICQNLKLKYVEKRLKLSTLKQADEIFLCNSTRGIVAVNQLDNLYFRTEAYSLVPFLQNSLLRYVKGRYGL